MKNTLIIAIREFRERLGSRSFILLAFLGPLFSIALIYMAFSLGGKQQQRWNVLISDKYNIMDNKIMLGKDASIQYAFVNEYIEIEEFAQGKQYQSYDALVEINEKILSNKTGFLFYREKPSMNTSISIRYQVERRLEEVLAQQVTKLSVNEFRKIKQPLQFGFRNVYDPTDSSNDLSAWVGFIFGSIILLFIFLFGMTILRSVSREKSNRIVEIILATVHPRQLMLGKILGIGLSAILQFLIWMLVIGIGLYAMRETVFVDIYSGENLVNGQASDYNELVELVFERIAFSNMITYFLLFFTVGYVFYGAFFAALGAIAGSESDGQQFLFPLLAILFFSIYAGYFSLQNPESGLTDFYHYFPFTAPIVVMVKLAIGYPSGQGYQLFLSLFILMISTFIILNVAARLYKNGILQFGHSVRFRQLFTWLKMK